MLTFERGADIGWTASNFVDEFGANFPVTAATVRVHYRVNKVMTEDIIQMTQAGTQMQGKWQSGVADLGLVEWDCKTSGNTIGVVEGAFMLVGNSANLSLASEPLES